MSKVSGNTHSNNQMNHYSNQNNPNNAAHTANNNNHSNQMNPNNSVYRSSRGGILVHVSICRRQMLR